MKGREELAMWYPSLIDLSPMQLTHQVSEKTEDQGIFYEIVSSTYDRAVAAMKYEIQSLRL